MWFETRQRIITILKELETSPVTGTVCNVADSIPGTRSDHHGYLITVRPTRGVLQPIVASEIRNHELNYTIECTSPQVLTNLPIVQEYRLDAYADVVTALLERFPRLEDPQRNGLQGVKKTTVGDAVFQSPKPYPDGQSQQMQYSFTIPLQIMYTRTTGC